MVEWFQDELWVRSLAAGLLASVACGVVGVYVVVKRIVFISGGIAHASLGGVGLAVWLGFSPFLGALAFGMVSAIVLGVTTLRGREQPDVIIGALWALGMALGIMFIGFASTGERELEHFLIGSIGAVGTGSLWASVALTALILCVVAFFYKEFLALSLDDEFSELRGVPVARMYTALLCMVAITVVVMIQVVGIVLVLALLTLPPATSRWFCKGLSGMMVMAAALGAFYTCVGLAVARASALSPGVCIILCAIAGYAAGMAVRGIRSQRRAAL